MSDTKTVIARYVDDLLRKLSSRFLVATVLSYYAIVVALEVGGMRPGGPLPDSVCAVADWLSARDSVLLGVASYPFDKLLAKGSPLLVHGSLFVVAVCFFVAGVAGHAVNWLSMKLYEWLVREGGGARVSIEGVYAAASSSRTGDYADAVLAGEIESSLDGRRFVSSFLLFLGDSFAVLGIIAFCVSRGSWFDNFASLLMLLLAAVSCCASVWYYVVRVVVRQAYVAGLRGQNIEAAIFARR